VRLFLENVRGFHGRHELQVKPLTLLVGENSSGKTSLLASLSAVLQRDFPAPDCFNRQPFELGTYDTIASFRGGKGGRSSTFSVGFEREEGTAVFAQFGAHLGGIRVRSISISLGGAELRGDPYSGQWLVKFFMPDTGLQTVNFNTPIPWNGSETIAGLAPYFYRALVEERGEMNATNAAAMQALFSLTEVVYQTPEALAFAPLRTRPRRTYDGIVEKIKPEGDHVPLVLSRVLGAEASKNADIGAALTEFGKASGLYTGLRVKRMGNRPSDPFQVRVKSAGPDVNLVDVGYGVSQALPIVVDSMLAHGETIVLVQQPEVHLHPRAQASLGTFFVQQAGITADRSFVIETHSDYLIDRVRTCVAEEKIDPQDVSLVFLEKVGLDTTIHHLNLDSHGNIVNAPPGYRKFFLEEELKVLYRGQK
jgi:energy-coupling factor transporter ATP-binding protein EcfA2